MTTEKKQLPRGVPEETTPIPGGMDKGEPPPFGKQRFMEDAGGPVPRVLDPLDRSPDKKKFVRYKVWCKNYQPQDTRYILGEPGEAGEAAVREHYLKVNGLADHLKQLRGNKVTPEEPLVLVKALED